MEERFLAKEKGWKEEEISLLQTVPGISWVLAYSAPALIGEVSRFDSSADFIVYCGLVLCKKG